MNKFVFQGDELRSVSELTFDTVIKGPTLNMIHTIYPNIVTQKQIGFVGKGGLVGVKNQGCNPKPQDWSIGTRLVEFDPVAWEILIAACWTDLYKGQIYYYSGAGEKEYPAPIFEAKLTNMRSEEGLDNVVGRNVTNHFLPGNIIADISGETESESQFKELQDEFRKYQNDESTGTTFLIQVKSKEELPVKIDLSSENYDKEFTVTQAFLPDAIGRAFSQPPILRAEKVTTGFSTDEMVNAYHFYNTQTEDERQDVSAVFTRLFRYWRSPGELTDATIMPLTYNVGASKAEQLGRDLMKDVLEIVVHEQLSTQQKVTILIKGYGFEPNEAVDFIKSNQKVGSITPTNRVVAKIRTLFMRNRKILKQQTA